MWLPFLISITGFMFGVAGFIHSYTAYRRRRR